MPAVTQGKVLVSGANGYIALWVVQLLLDHGFSVRGTVRADSKVAHLKETFKEYGDKLEVVVVPDITKVRVLFLRIGTLPLDSPDSLWPGWCLRRSGQRRRRDRTHRLAVPLQRQGPAGDDHARSRRHRQHPAERAAARERHREARRADRVVRDGAHARRRRAHVLRGRLERVLDQAGRDQGRRRATRRGLPREQDPCRARRVEVHGDQQGEAQLRPRGDEPAVCVRPSLA